MLDRGGREGMAVWVNALQNRELNDEFGLDVRTWAQEKLAQMISPYVWEPGSYRGARHQRLALDYYRESLAGTDSQLWPFCYQGVLHRHALPRVIRAYFLEQYQSGALDGVCAWDPDRSVMDLDVDRPVVLEVWDEVTRPLPIDRIRTLGGYALDEYSPHYGG